MPAVTNPRSVMSVMPLMRLALLLLLALGLSAADKKPEVPLPPPSLDGYAFALTYPTEKGKPKDKLTFTETAMKLASLPDLTFTLKVVRKGKKAKEFDFSGSATDAKGVVIEISGKVEIDGDDMHGSVFRRPKDEDATAANFSGKIAAAPKPKK
jgi:hypothetical protein